MFDTMKTAQKIREARIALNMTQMNLADAMEVSYQAVSNWERGNSMPDIAKLEQLCQVLQINMEELLGADNSKTITKVIHIDKEENSDDTPVSIEDIRTLAPILPPDTVEKLVDDNLEHEPKEKFNFSAILGLAPFLDEKYLDTLVKRAQIDDLAELAGLAPFLGEETLNSLVLNANMDSDLSGVVTLAPFLSKETLDKFVQKMQSAGNLKELTALGPFLSEETLNSLVLNADLDSDLSDLSSLAPFLSKGTLGKLVGKLLKK